MKNRPIGTADMDEILKLDNQLCFSLYAASRKITALYAPLLTRLDITYTQYLTLLVLWERHEAPVKELGARLMLDSGTLTPLLKKMEEKGIVTRTRSEVDERSVRIGLTPKGAAMRKDALDFVPGMACSLAKQPVELARLRDEVRNLLDSLV